MYSFFTLISVQYNFVVFFTSKVFLSYFLPSN
nr:MAG TPA: hypothetical protein [Caudoviricetes sp.]